jgi:hypothetical protein
MGLHVTGTFLPHETTADKWASAYAEVLELVEAYDFLDIIFDRERFANYGVVWHYGVKTVERKWESENDTASKNLINTMTLPKPSLETKLKATPITIICWQSAFF